MALTLEQMAWIKRSIVGTFHKFRKKYMSLHVAEFQFR